MSLVSCYLKVFVWETKNNLLSPRKIGFFLNKTLIFFFIILIMTWIYALFMIARLETLLWTQVPAMAAPWLVHLIMFHVWTADNKHSLETLQNRVVTGICIRSRNSIFWYLLYILNIQRCLLKLSSYVFLYGHYIKYSDCGCIFNLFISSGKMNVILNNK